ncbi:hypothetical protein [Skermanella pratensis]|uniref:hypothetical protein n=1 Tax=Skermanella pratensis TaxID=2233999 RepID=UPI001788732D|nr:hypothetical protein [Skermanella pratensis]
MTTRLLPQQPAPVTRRDAALTARFLLPASEALEELFLDLRAETDRLLGPAMGARYGKPYPLGCCREITQDVLGRLGGVLAKPDHRGARALSAFLAAGGAGRCVWGALRGRYFQTALQFGGLYVDVANDTVTVTKPKVEILPLEEAGLEAVRGAEHFAEIADAYWGMRIVANHALPSLAPLLPMIGVIPGRAPVLHSATRYMTELFRQDGFARSEAWLTNGPVPPAEVVEALRARCPEDLLTADPHTGVRAAVAACRSARAAGLAASAEWRDARVRDFLRIFPVQPDPSPDGASSSALNIVWKADPGGRRHQRRHRQDAN